MIKELREESQARMAAWQQERESSQAGSPSLRRGATKRSKKADGTSPTPISPIKVPGADSPSKLSHLRDSQGDISSAVDGEAAKEAE